MPGPDRAKVIARIGAARASRLIRARRMAEEARVLPYLRYLLKNSDWKFLAAAIGLAALILGALFFYR